MSLCMLILFIYLSVSFSVPMSDEFRTRFLLLFQKNDLGVVREAAQNRARQDSHKARINRYNRTAFRDAELIIIRALTKYDDSSS